MQIINQIFEILNLLYNLTDREREELVDDYRLEFIALDNLIIKLRRIVDGETPYGRQIKWGCHPWQQYTYRQQHGLTLQAGWDDIVDFGISLGEIVKIAVPRRYNHSSTPFTPIEEHKFRYNTVSDVCELDYVPHLQRLALCEAVVNIPSQSNSEGGSSSSTESDTVHFDLDNLSTDEIDSTPDSLPDLEDHLGQIVERSRRIHTRRARPTRLHLPVGPAQAWRNLFRPPQPRDEGPPWREVLGFMLNEQLEGTYELAT